MMDRLIEVIFTYGVVVAISVALAVIGPQRHKIKANLPTILIGWTAIMAALAVPFVLVGNF